MYAFGYPLNYTEAWTTDDGGQSLGLVSHRPRVTSAIVASTLDLSGPVSWPGPPTQYVLDKALNRGNSGGPIVAQDTGRVHALCSRFQPMMEPQHHLKEPGKPMPFIRIPSLYGVVASLGNPIVVAKLREFGVPIDNA